MLLDGPRRALRPAELPLPEPRGAQLLIRVRACGVCRTDLHVADGDLPEPKSPLILGHEIVGTVAALGPSAEGPGLGRAVGVGWLGGACGGCRYCREGRENLCPDAGFTGYRLDGGYAEYAVADSRYCYELGPALLGPQAAPLLCAGLIGYRALKAAGPGEALGLYGFGGSAHIVAQVARSQGRRVYAFTRPGDAKRQAFARGLGVVWAGDSESPPPEELDAAILFAPAGELVPVALRAVRPGGTVVCAGIHMSDLPSFPYRLLWGERCLRSVANLTRDDGREFLALAARLRPSVSIETFPLERANEALDALRSGRLEGAAVLVM